MPKYAGALPAGLLVLFASAAAVTADELAQAQEPLPWNTRDASPEIRIDEGVTTTPAVTDGAANVVGVEDGLLVQPDILEEAPAGIGEPAPAWLPELSADADMSECARDLLRSRLATTVTEDDILAAMALEAELLTLCHERQELVLTLYQVEAELTDLQPPAVEEAGEAAAAPPTVLEHFVGPPALEVEVAVEEPAATPVAEETPEEEPQPTLAWFSILGVQGALRAGVTDGEQVWWVTEGTELPGGVTVDTITGRPPQVVVAGDESATLPWSQRPGGL